MENTNHTPSPITVVIIEDHPIFRDGLVKLFDQEDDFYVLATAEDARQGLEVALTHRPDVVISDISLPHGNGLELAKQIKSQLTQTAIVILTYHENDFMVNALNSGASAYCHKSISADDLVNVARKVKEGYFYLEGRFMCRNEAKQFLNNSVNGILRPYIKNARHENIFLSPRERDILKSVVEGKSNKEISRQLHISQQTVKNHMTSILTKLDVRDRTQAVITAIRHGWINIHDDFIDL